MKAIQELILNKMVPLGFEEKELMYTVQVKMNENVFKTKKDGYWGVSKILFWVKKIRI